MPTEPEERERQQQCYGAVSPPKLAHRAGRERTGGAEGAASRQSPGGWAGVPNKRGQGLHLFP